MRISFVLPGYPWKPVGGYRVVYEYANHLVARGHEVAIVHPRRLPNWDRPMPPSVYRRLRRKLGKLRNMLLKPKVTWQPIDRRVQMLFVPEPNSRYVPDGDAVFATWWATAELVNELPVSKGQKFYLIQHYEIWGGPKDRVDATWRLPLKKVVIARWLYEKGLELGVSPDDMIHIPNGINHDIFRLKRPIENRPKRVAMMFSLAEWKGGADGVKALELAKKEMPDLSAVLFGTTRRPKWLPKWIEYYQNPAQDFLVDEIYNGSAVYLCPSWIEGWGLPSAEAMACGCAVVSVDNGGVRDYAEHEKTSLLCPPKDPQALASALVRLLKDDGLRYRLAKAGYERIITFKWEHSSTLLEEFIMSWISKQ